MHRIDVCRATGRHLLLTAEHDGRLVDDLVAEWAELHGHAFTLLLTCSAGGRWKQGTAAQPERMSLDAVEFCRILSGRASGSGLLGTRVNF